MKIMLVFEHFVKKLEERKQQQPKSTLKQVRKSLLNIKQTYKLQVTFNCRTFFSVNSTIGWLKKTKLFYMNRTGV